MRTRISKLILIGAAALVLIAVFYEPTLTAEADTHYTQKSLDVRVSVDVLRCDKTTEMGEDEVYFIFVNRFDDGRLVTQRQPCDTAHADACHWNLNDGKAPREMGPTAYRFTLKPGERTMVYWTIMEEDGGLPGDWAQKTGEALMIAGTPKMKAAGAVLEILGQLASIFKIGEDTDDIIGSFAVSLANENGKLKYEYFQGLGVVRQDGGTIRLKHLVPGKIMDRAMIYDFEHDGAKYQGFFYLED